MAEVKYKEYSEEEDRIYCDAIAKVRECLACGATMEEACEALGPIEEQLRGFIEDDALKIAIAEMYFSQGLALDILSDRLRVPLDKLQKALGEMLEDVGQSSSEYYRMTHGEGSFGNA